MRENQTIKEIRITMFLFGYDLLGYSDNEIKEGVEAFANIICNTGITAQEMTENLKEIFRS